jgi:hypothetical protein
MDMELYAQVLNHSNDDRTRVASQHVVHMAIPDNAEYDPANLVFRADIMAQIYSVSYIIYKKVKTSISGSF